MRSKTMIPLKKTAWLLTGCLLIVFGLIQLIRPEVTHPLVTGDFKGPENVKAIFRRACYDCHSNQTQLSWFDQVAPVYWKVAQHVKEGREGLNFSNWDKLAPPDQKAKLWEAVNQITAGAMPIRDYELVHPSSKISAGDIQTLKNYLDSMVHSKPADTAKLNALDKQARQQTHPETALPTAANGITYIPDYKNWQTVSTTERFDNGTMRVIFGNPIAIKAIQEHHISPWPNGTIFAKVAWDQVQDKEGNITTGAFKQVEYMIKDDQKYAATAGWGWARFKTPKMVPYGKNVLFTTECVNCHRPVKDEDFVFTMPIKN